MWLIVCPLEKQSVMTHSQSGISFLESLYTNYRLLVSFSPLRVFHVNLDNKKKKKTISYNFPCFFLNLGAEPPVYIL